jgi:predicted metalloprotease with PDZ domain
MPMLAVRLVAFAVFTVSAFGCGTAQTTRGPVGASDPLDYTVDLTDRTGDTFKVMLRVGDLGPGNAVYQFASTAPGTYQVMDIGRYVRSFEALDADGTVIPSEQVSTNQWRIADPEAVTAIRYEVAETWDTPVSKHPIYLMAGTSIEDDHVQINGQAVFGYPTGMQARPLRIRLRTPDGWTVGTALETDDAGRYLAPTYDFVVDSPILAGQLSTASLDVRGTDVDIYTYSKSGAVAAGEILASVDAILEGAGRFLGELPVDRYAFLFHFEDVTAGAWEHSYSSTYAFAEADFPGLLASGQLADIAAHEFLHIVTPLNIHSDVIEQFDFVEPTPSEHVWLYEGVTEWMAQTAQLRGGLIDLDTYLDRLSGKLQGNDHYDAGFSLSDLGLQSYSEKGQQQWGNIYQRGAVVAALLDIELLAHSGGERGLREVILELAEDYGPDDAFDEATFFDEFAERTYPEIRSFFEAYVRDTEPLPLAATFAKVGTEYLPEVRSGEDEASFDITVGVAGQQVVVLGTPSGAAAACGIRGGDVIAAVEGQEVTLQTAQQAFMPLPAAGVGEPFTLGLQRDGEALTVTCAKESTERVDRHVLRVAPDATPEQVALREAWARTL